MFKGIALGDIFFSKKKPQETGCKTFIECHLPINIDIEGEFKFSLEGVAVMLAIETAEGFRPAEGWRTETPGMAVDLPYDRRGATRTSKIKIEYDKCPDSMGRAYAFREILVTPIDKIAIEAVNYFLDKFRVQFSDPHTLHRVGLAELKPFSYQCVVGEKEIVRSISNQQVALRREIPAEEKMRQMSETLRDPDSSFLNILKLNIFNHLSAADFRFAIVDTATLIELWIDQRYKEIAGTTQAEIDDFEGKTLGAKFAQYDTKSETAIHPDFYFVKEVRNRFIHDGARFLGDINTDKLTRALSSCNYPTFTLNEQKVCDAMDNVFKKVF